jgi:ABC-type Zn uptake system ZnuABC Zn-binding protein ZnuA
MKYILTIMLFMLVVFPMTAADPRLSAATEPPRVDGLKVVAVETFLADVAQQVAGDRLKVTALMPIGVDPHSFEPTPVDVRKVADCNLLIVNGAGFEEFLDELLKNAGGAHKVIEASAGLTSRSTEEESSAGMSHTDSAEPQGEHHHHEGDPHFWLVPGNMIQYVQNIRKGLSEVDPGGAKTYAANAHAYIGRLNESDRWIGEQVALVPPDRRLLVTNHESLGYFADHYGFKIIGTIVPSVSTGSSPSAKQLAALADRVKATGAKAIFLETGTNPQLARQLAKETGIKVVTDLYTHSISTPSGPAPSYLDMMKHNTSAIVNALR